MNTYICFYKQNQIEIQANTSLQAQQKAQVEFQKKEGKRKVKSYDITPMLHSTPEEVIIHKPNF